MVKIPAFPTRALVLLTVMFSMAPLAALGRPAQIILLRHGEKPDDESNIHLSYEGKQRARALADLLTTDPQLITNGLPVALFATHPTIHGHSRRTAETLQPLAEKLKLPVQTPYGAKDFQELADRLLHNHEFDGKTVVVCWVHDYLPQLAKALGAKPARSPWKGSVFDRLWVITYHHKKASLEERPQLLRPGDATK